MGVAFDVAAALEEPIKITQAIGFANKRARQGDRKTSEQGAQVNIDRAPRRVMRQMRTPRHLMFGNLIVVNF
ncbi:hypothetical protein [Paraburkholderia sp. JHI869]|uniref:hypothetical protein n=1 Tax=Paraburkholderia sp. JHI869 TaxID=3112959 RepID=UPI00317BE619